MSDAAELGAVFEQRPQNLVVTLFGAYVHPDDRAVWSGGLVALLGDLGFSAGAARVALARLTGRGLLVRVRDGRLVHYRLTARASALLDEGDRRIFSLGRNVRPPQVWTVLWHAIPEERRVERARLARRLRFLGFGSPQDGLWISPHDRAREVAPLLEELGVVGLAAVLAGRPGSTEFDRFAARAWDLGEVRRRYRAFVAAFGRYAGGRADGVGDAAAFVERTRLAHAFREFPSLDPGLPEDVAPTGGYRARAVEIFRDVYTALAEPAQRHFDAATAPPASRPHLPKRAGPRRAGVPARS